MRASLAVAQPKRRCTVLSVLRDLLKGPGNRAWDLGRFMSAAGLLSLIGAQFHALIIGQVLDVFQFGGGIAAVLGGAGALIALKDKSAPQPPE